jgi:hypothetical protein
MYRMTLSRIVLIIALGFAGATGQSRYPADTLLTAPGTPLLRQIALVPIAAWQRLSYNTSLLDCQFYPSCSNYGAQAIRTHGLLKGAPMAMDRIIRCSPFAYHYHLALQGAFHPDGRLVDPVVPPPVVVRTTEKNPRTAALLSALLPGAGRAYAGRWWDGLMGLLVFSLSLDNARTARQLERPLATPFWIGVTALVYSGEIYGAWRTAKYYQPRGDIVRYAEE